MYATDAHDYTFDLEAKISLKIQELFEFRARDSSFKIEPSDHICSLLELYIPTMLSKKYPIWASESIDGIFVEGMNNREPYGIEIYGACILISDQTLTPFSLFISVDAKHKKIDSYSILVGEPGNGRLKISGPPFGSMKAHKMLANISRRLSDIDWSYSLANGNVDDLSLGEE